MSATFESLITEYADRIGAAVGIEVTDDDRTPAGFPALLTTCAQRVGDYNRDWLQEAADDLDAINRLGDQSIGAKKLLNRVHDTLYDAVTDMEMC